MPGTIERRRDQAIQDIARLYFNFPNEESPSLKTIINSPTPTMPLQDEGGKALYPDIVVVRASDNTPQMVALVEAAATEERARERWLPCARLPLPFYLYVPLEEVERAKALLKRLKIRVTGLRSWRYLVGYKSIEVTEIYNQPSPLSMLLPRILIPRRLRSL